MKILKSKKGINDISILAMILTVFLLTALLMPMITNAFTGASDTYQIDPYTGKIISEAENVQTITAFTVITATLKLAFYDFGNTLGLPFWLDIIYTILAIIFILVVARNLWIGGGG